MITVARAAPRLAAGAAPYAEGDAADREWYQSSGRAAKACLMPRYQSIDFLGCRQRLFMASRASWCVVSPAFSASLRWLCGDEVVRSAAAGNTASAEARRPWCIVMPS
jgi:hypothetical protein